MSAFLKPINELYLEFLDLTRDGSEMTYEHFERLMMMIRYHSKTPMVNSFNSTFTQETNLYGDQTIHDRGVYVATRIGSSMILGKYSFMHIIMILGFIRFLIEVDQAEQNKREVCHQMGLLRSGKHVIESVTTILKGDRLSTAQKLIALFNSDASVTYQEGTVRWIYHMSENNDEKYGMIIVNNSPDLPHTSITSVQEFDEAYITHQTGIYDDWCPDEKYYRLLSSLFESAVIDLSQIAALHWHMCIRVPHVRGGGTIAEMLTLVLFEYHSIPFTRWIAEPWIYAVCSTQSDFINNFSSLYE